jgi:hypothetical protein
MANMKMALSAKSCQRIWQRGISWRWLGQLEENISERNDIIGVAAKA